MIHNINYFLTCEKAATEAIRDKQRATFIVALVDEKASAIFSEEFTDDVCSLLAYCTSPRGMSGPRSAFFNFNQVMRPQIGNAESKNVISMI